MDDDNVILVNKPLGWTSYQVVRIVKKVLKAKKVGHTGTLDPLASGLLILCCNEKTKAIAHYQDMDKVYVGSFDLGKTTPSFDLETDFDQVYDHTSITPAMVHAVAKTLEGKIWQTPPPYAAIKQKGVRAYTSARRGKPMDLPPRLVDVKSFEVTGTHLPRVDFRIRCGKGVYIRSMAHDVGKALGVGAFLHELTRVQIGAYHVRNALMVREIIRSANPNAFYINGWSCV